MLLVKKSIFCVCLIVSLLAGDFTAVFAVPLGSSNMGREYLVGAGSPYKWSFGAYVETRERDVAIDRLSSLMSMKSSKIMGYVGYDFLSWFTTYFTAGQHRARIGSSGYADGELECGMGMHFNLLDQEILDPTLFEDKIRINADWQYTTSKTEYGSEVKKWRELFLALTISIVNDIEGNKLYLPNSVAVFWGPLYSDIQGGSINEKDKIGFTAGLEVFFTEKISLNLAIESFDEVTHIGGINVRF